MQKKMNFFLHIYKKAMENILKDIKLDFLGLIKSGKSGYFINLEQVYNWLDNIDICTQYETSESFRRNFKKRYLRNDKFLLDEALDDCDLDKDYIMIKNKDNIAFPWFSIEGFKVFCMVVNEPKSSFVRKYFIQVEKDYLRVLEQTSENNKLELDTLNIALYKNKISLDKLSNNCDKYLQDKLSIEYKLKKIQNLELILHDKSDFILEGNIEYKCYTYLRNTYMKKIPLYIINQDYIIPKAIKLQKPKRSCKVLNIVKNTKEFSVSSDSDSEIEITQPKNIIKKNKAFNSAKLNYTKQFDNYNFHQDILVDVESGNDSPTLYYYIAGFNEKSIKNAETYYKICDLYVHDNEHLSNIKEQLDTISMISDKYIYKTAKKWIYKVDYTTIKNISLTITQNRLHNTLI